MKHKGDKATYGYGAPPSLASAELYKARTGFKAIGIPYKTSMASLPEMFSGEIDFQFIDSTAGYAPAHSGKVRALAVTTGERVPGVDLPTMAEAAGIPEFDIAPLWGVLLPAGTPAPIVARRERWFAQIIKMDATRQYPREHQWRAVSGCRQGPGRFHPKGNQEVGRTGQACENRAAMRRMKFFGSMS